MRRKWWIFSRRIFWFKFVCFILYFTYKFIWRIEIGILFRYLLGPSPSDILHRFDSNANADDKCSNVVCPTRWFSLTLSEHVVETSHYNLHLIPIGFFLANIEWIRKWWILSRIKSKLKNNKLIENQWRIEKLKKDKETWC